MSFRIDQLAVLNLATVGNSITAGSFVKSGGTSSQFLKADGTVDTNAYITGITSTMVTTALGYTPVPNTRNITINGVTQDLSVDRTWTISAGVASVSGSGAGISVSPTTGAVVVSNTGVTSNVAGTGISVSGATGAVTITNTGVTSIVAGTAITISGATGAVTINNAGVTSVNGSTGALTGFATQAWVTSQGYITGNQTITLSGDVSGSGTTSISVTVNQIDGWSFVNTGSNSGTAADSINSNGISYVNTNISLFGQTDGALYSQAYSSSWQHQIYGDYRTGQIAIRGKDNGTWQSWRTVLDSTNYSSIISGSFVQNVLGDSGAYNLNTSGQQAFFRFSTGAWVNGPTTGNYSHVLSVNGATDNRTFQVYFGDVPGYLWWRPNQGGTWHGWERILTSYNYNGWAPTLTGGGASGTWSINITGNAATATNATAASYAQYLTSSNYIQRTGSSGNYNTDFSNTPAGSVRHLGDDAGAANNPGGSWWFVDNYRHSNSSNIWGTQIAWGWEDNANRLAQRNVTGGSWSGWVYYLNSGNYNSYAPTLTGGGASGTWSINITGSAGSASSASSVPWTGVSSGTRTNYNLRFQPSTNDYAGFEFNTSTGGGGGYFLIRGTSDNDVYTAEGITLVADAGWLTLAQRTTSDKGVRIMTGSTSTTRMAFNANGTTYLYTDLYLGSTNTRITASDATGYLRIYGSSSNYLAIGPYNNNGWVYFENIANTNGMYFNSPGRYAFDSVDLTPYTDAENSLGNGSFRWSQVYTSGWLRQYGAQGMYNQDYGTHFYSNGGSSWGITGSGGNVELQFRSNHQSTIRGYVYADTGNNIGFLNNGGSWSLRTDSSRNTILYGQLTVGQDIGYSSIYMYDSDEGTREIHCNSNRIGFLTQAGSWGAWLYDGADWEAASSVRAPIFYDSDNTAYYGNFASTSRMAYVTMDQSIGAHNHMTYGGYWSGGDWQTLTNTEGQLNIVQVNNINGGGYSNQPPNVYTYGGVLSWRTSNHSFQLYASHTGDITFKTQWNNDNYSGWRRILHESNFNSWAPTLTGGGASGTWSINITGSAGSASTASQVTINYNNDSNSTYQLLWGSGNSVYGTSQVYVNPSSDVIYARGGYISPGNAWGTADSAFFPNGITTAGSTNWVYGRTYIGNAPGNGSGVDISSVGSSYFLSGNTSGTWGYAGQFVDRNNAANNYIPWSFESEYGNHSWGIVARFHIQQSGADKPAIQFTATGSNERWSLGYCTGSDYNFRITQNQAYRTDNSGQDGWGTERFRINTDGTTYLGIQGQIVYFNGAESANLYGIRGRFTNEYMHLYNKVGVGHPGGWGQGEGSTPNQGLSTYGGANFAYGTGATSTFYGHLRVTGNNNLYLDSNFGQSIIGLYASTRYQGVFAMGDAYKLPIDGTGPGNLYGLAWSHPNAGGVAGNLNTHGLLVLENGTFLAAISGSIRARDDMRAPIFYDSDNTGYYLNPAGTSNLYAISNYTRQGAFNMGRENTVRRDITSDQNYWGGAWGWGTGYGTWADAWKTGFSSWDIWGSGTDHPQGSGYVHAQGIISGQHYCTADGGQAYGWMIVGGHDAINRWWLRGKWGGTTRPWVEMITTDNIGSQNVNYANQAGTASFASSAGNTSSISSAVGGTYTWTGIQYFQSNLGGYCGSLSGPPLQAYSTGNNSAFFSFHKSGVYAVNMGLDADSVLRIGGWSASANRWQLDMSGNMTVAGDVTAYSDARVKENVETVEDALDKVLNLRGVYYNRTDSDDKRRKVGVIAQEILEVIPEVVGQDNDGMYNVSYGNIVGVLIEAIKEQQKQIDELKARLD